MDAQAARPKIKLDIPEIPPFSPSKREKNVGSTSKGSPKVPTTAVLSKEERGNQGARERVEGKAGAGNGGDKGPGGVDGGAVKKRRFTTVLKDALVQVRIRREWRQGRRIALTQQFISPEHTAIEKPAEAKHS